jgi:hypothetical protein
LQLTDFEKLKRIINEFDGPGDLYITSSRLNAGRFYLKRRVFNYEVEWDYVFGSSFGREIALNLIRETDVTAWSSDVEKKLQGKIPFVVVDAWSGMEISAIKTFNEEEAMYETFSLKRWRISKIDALPDDIPLDIDAKSGFYSVYRISGDEFEKINSREKILSVDKIEMMDTPPAHFFIIER